MDRPYMPSKLSSNFSRDWPDARGIWIHKERKMVAYLNRKDHILLSLTEKTGDFESSFKQFAQFEKDVRGS